MVFIDLEKAYDRVPRQEVWRSLRQKRVPEKYVRLVQEMYRDVQTSVRSGMGETDCFEVKVGLHQGSALSPFLFNIVMDVVSEEVRERAPWCMMYADDVVLCARTKEEVEQTLETWRGVMEDRGLKISRTKTEYLRCGPEQNQGEEHLMLDEERIERSNWFKYLGSKVDEDGGVERERD